MIDWLCNEVTMTLPMWGWILISLGVIALIPGTVFIIYIMTISTLKNIF